MTVFLRLAALALFVSFLAGTACSGDHFDAHKHGRGQGRNSEHSGEHR